MLESWHINLIIAIVTVIIAIATIKFKTETVEKNLTDESKRLDACFKKLDDMNKKVIENSASIKSIPTMEVVRQEFVSKEMYRQLEKHIDEKFTRLEGGIEKILNKLDSKG